MSQFSRYPGAGSTGSGGAVPAYYNFAAFPDTAPDGALAVALDDDSLYIFDGATATWLALASNQTMLSIGTIDSQAKAANGAVISATQLFMQTADATHPGLISTGTQTIAGDKTFTGNVTLSGTLDIVNLSLTGTLHADGATTLGSTLAVTSTISGSNLSGTNTGDVTIGSFGAAPDAKGLTISGQVITLQPADATHPGAVTTAAQTLAGAKTFSGAGIFSSTLDVTGNFNVATNKFSVVAASGNTSIAGTLALTSDLAVATNKFTVAAATGNTLVAGTLAITSDLAVATNKFTVAAATGNALIAGTLALTSDLAIATSKFTVTASSGNTSIAGTLGVAGAVTNSSTTQMTGNVGIGGASAAAQVTCTRCTALTGTWSNSAGGTAVTGVGTKAMSELVIGCNFIINGETVVVTAITTDTAITTATIIGANSGVAATTTAVADHYVYSNGCFQSGGTRTSLVLSGQSNTNLIVGDAATAGGTSNNTPSLMVLAYSGTSATTSGQLVMAKSRGNEAGPVTVSSGDRMGLVVSKAYDGTSMGAGQRITFLATETWGSSAHGCKMQLATVANTTTASVVGIEIGSEGDVVLGPQAANATSATGGYTYMPTCAGTPTGVPVGYTGKVAWIYDTSNNIIYIYNGGWKKTVALT